MGIGIDLTEIGIHDGNVGTGPAGTRCQPGCRPYRTRGADDQHQVATVDGALGGREPVQRQSLAEPDHAGTVVGRGNATMVGMAATLKDAEMKQIAAYISSLPGELKTVPHAKFR